MTDTTENASTRELTMKDFFKEENGEIVPVDESVLIDFKDGDIVEGEVVRIDKDEVLVDIGYKSEGLIPSNELSIRKGADPTDIVELGQHVEALVLQKEDADGRLILSVKRAAFEKAWNRIEESYNERRTVEGPVIEVVKGGLILDIGLRGFLPASLVDIRRVGNLEAFLGEKLECKVIELNRSRNNVVLSRRAVLEEERKEERERILNSLEEGMIVTGTVSNLGAFVEVAEGVEGLIHISELADHHVETPDEIVRSGDEVEARIIDVDARRRRLSLSLRPKREEREDRPRREERRWRRPPHRRLRRALRSGPRGEIAQTPAGRRIGDGPVTVAVTGSFASGKSTFVNILGELGAETVSADEIVHDLLAADEQTISLVAERFGREVLKERGVDRRALGRRVFGDSEALRDLEEILHPLVRRETDRRIAASGAGLFVAEIPLLFEGGSSGGRGRRRGAWTRRRCGP